MIALNKGIEMDKINIVSNCNRVVERKKPEMKDWGFSIMVDTEIEALQVAYAYRYSKHGVKAEHCPNVNQFMVTVFNERAAKLGLNK